MKFPNDKHQGPNKDQEDKQQIPNKTDRSLLGQSTIGDLELKPRDSSPGWERQPLRLEDRISTIAI
jgi:hypothetical protein